MYYVEFTLRSRLRAGVDENDIAWSRYRPGFESFERADNEALWLSTDDDQYAYRVIEVTNE